MVIDLDVEVAISLTTDEIAIDAEDIALLAHIEETASLRQACLAIGRSYAHALRRLETLDAIGPLTERTRGGPDGGGTHLTEQGREVIATFTRVEQALAVEAHRHDNHLAGELIDRDGALATIDTSAGPITAVVPRATERVTLGVAPEAITLYPESDRELPHASSARNTLTARVETIDTADEIPTVSLRCGEVSLQSAVTQESLDRLDLEIDDSVVAAFKATATRPIVTPE